MQDIKIKGVTNGWIVEIGCSTFVSEDKDKMLSEIGKYIEHPEKEEARHMAEAKNERREPQPLPSLNRDRYAGTWTDSPNPIPGTVSHFESEPR